MMIQRSLIDDFKKAGLTVIEMDDWENTGENDGPFDPIGVVLHHDAMGLHNMNVPNYMRQNGVGGSQLWIRYDGALVIMAAGRKWHAGLGIGYNDIRKDHGNTDAIGIETDYSGTGPWDSRMLVTINTTCRVIKKHYGWKKENFCGHKEYTRDTGRKIDPSNFDLNAWRSQLDDPIIVVSDENNNTNTPPAPEKDEFDMATKDELRALLLEPAFLDAVAKAVTNYHGLVNNDNAAQNSNIGWALPAIGREVSAIKKKLGA